MLESALTLQAQWFWGCNYFFCTRINVNTIRKEREFGVSLVLIRNVPREESFLGIGLFFSNANQLAQDELGFQRQHKHKGQSRSWGLKPYPWPKPNWTCDTALSHTTHRLPIVVGQDLSSLTYSRGSESLSDFGSSLIFKHTRYNTSWWYKEKRQDSRQRGKKKRQNADYQTLSEVSVDRNGLSLMSWLLLGD